MDNSGIDIAKYLARIEENIKAEQTDPICCCLPEFMTEVRSKLISKGNLKDENGQYPLLELYSLEFQMWAKAVLSSAWSVWCFTAKTNDEGYQKNEKKGHNAKIIRPCVENLIRDAMKGGSKIGSRKESNFRPENTEEKIGLRCGNEGA